MERQRDQNRKAKNYFEKKNKLGGISQPNFKTSIATAIKTVVLVEGHNDQCTGTNEPRN